MSHFSEMLALLLLVLVIRTSHSSTFLLSAINGYDKNCIMLENFVSEGIIFLSERKELLEQCIKFDTKGMRTIFLWKSFKKRPTKYSGSYVLLMDLCRSSNQLQATIREIDDNSRNYIIICKRYETDDGIKEIFNTIYTVGATAVKIITHSFEETIIYSWDPYQEHSKCGKMVNFTVTRTSNDLKFNISDASLSNRKMDLKNCAIKIAWIRIPPFVVNVTQLKRPGMYVSLFNTISELTGAKILYTESEEFTKEFINNGTYHQLTRYLQNGSADVGIGRLYMNSSHASVGPCIFSDEMVFLARKRRKFSSYRYLFKIFTSSLWLFMVFVFFVSSAVFLLSGKCFKESRIDFYKMLFELFRMCLGTSGKILFKTHNMRVLLVFYSLYCLNMDSIYLSKLSSQLSISDQEKKISHVDILVEYHVHIYAPWIGERLGLLIFYSSRNKTWNRGGHVVNYTEYQLLKHIASHQENSTIAFMSTLNTFPSETAASTVFRWPMYWPLFVTYYLRPNNPLNKIINYWTEETFEKGFMQKWWYDISRSNINRSLTKEETVSQVISLKVAHFEEIFYVLVGGWLVATISFFLEMSTMLHDI